MTTNGITTHMMKTRLFAGFSPADCARVAAAVNPSVRGCAGGETLIDEDGQGDFFAILTKGRLAAEKYRYDGNAELVQIYTVGDLIGLDIVCTPTRRYPFRIVCIADTEVVLFPYDRLMRRETLPDALRERLRDNIIQVLANENIKKLYKIDVLYKRALRERILVFLRNVSARTGERAVRIHMDREQFSRFLGVNRSALSHELSLMRKEGIITFHKDQFEIK